MQSFQLFFSFKFYKNEIKTQPQKIFIIKPSTNVIVYFFEGARLLFFHKFSGGTFIRESRVCKQEMKKN